MRLKKAAQLRTVCRQTNTTNGSKPHSGDLFLPDNRDIQRENLNCRIK